MRVALHAAAVAGLLTVAGCGVLGGNLTPEAIRIPCPQVLVFLNLPERPAPPRWGEDDLAGLATFAEGLGAYANGLEEQAARREQQHATCLEATKGSGGR